MVVKVRVIEYSPVTAFDGTCWRNFISVKSIVPGAPEFFIVCDDERGM